MLVGIRAEFNLLAARIFGIGQQDPAFLAHGLETGMNGGRRPHLALRHQITDAQPLLACASICDLLQKALLKRVQQGQGWQSSYGFRQLQKT